MVSLLIEVEEISVFLSVCVCARACAWVYMRVCTFACHGSYMRLFFYCVCSLGQTRALGWMASTSNMPIQPSGPETSPFQRKHFMHTFYSNTQETEAARSL